MSLCVSKHSIKPCVSCVGGVQFQGSLKGDYICISHQIQRPLNSAYIGFVVTTLLLISTHRHWVARIIVPQYIHVSSLNVNISDNKNGILL